MNIVLIGAGNLGWHLASHLAEADLTIRQIVSKTPEHARKLGQLVNASFTINMEEIEPDADFYIYAVPDDQLPSVIKQNPVKTGIHCHTAGSLPIQLFENQVENYGIFYPLQTFSKQKQIEFYNIPILLEANNKKTLLALQKLAAHLTNNTLLTTFQQRQALHLAAVFACNFSNNLYAIAEQMMNKVNLSFDLLIPLIHETVEKAVQLHPLQAQTGPASRNDQKVIETHLTLLQHDERLQTLYRLFTDNIQQMKNAANEH
jgi:predicted short-subunit dehydrogenase-like oxidoreductase (DUF2520 family)